jgi:hypothetical protein
MVQGSQTQWVPILQYSSHRSKLTKQTINLKYSLNATISPLKYVKTKNPPPTSDSRTHSPNTLFLLPHKKISDTRDWTTDARALRERERERASESQRASEKAWKLAQLCKGRKCRHVTGFRARPRGRPPRYVGWRTVPAELRTLGLNWMVLKPKGF